MATVQPFKIEVEAEVLHDLSRRIQNTRWPRPLNNDPDRETAGWDHGTNLEYLKELADYWLYEYNWRKQEEILNRAQQYKVNIGEVRLHYIHERGKGSRPIPLLLLHGWPDSFYRFHKITPMLTGNLAEPQPSVDDGFFADGAGTSEAAASLSFDVIIPSLPGFGFTECPAGRPKDRPIRHDAELLWTLMTGVLGYERFGIVGGDGGSPMAQLIAIDHPESVIGIYLTDLGWQASSADHGTLTKKEQQYLKEAQKEFMKQGAYAMVQSTRPQTLAYELNDSPVGLAAWILDRFYFWSDTGGNIEKSFSKDELLTNIMIYWVTGTMPSSIRNYALDMRSPSLTTKDHVEVPTGLGLFPKEVGGIPPREFAERTLNVRHWTEMSRGGHFTAWEEPEPMAADLREFFLMVSENDKVQTINHQV